MSDQTRECPRCGTRQDQGWLCDGCRRHVRVTLRAIAHDWPDLMDTFARQVSHNSEGRGIGHAQPLPFDEQAAQCSRDIRNVLVTAVKLIVDDLSAPTPPDRIGAMCGLLEAWLPVIRKQAWAVHLADELDDLHSRLLRTLQHGAGQQITLTRAACPVDGGPLRSRIGLDWGQYPFIRCTVCGTTWDATTWDELLAQSQARDDAIPEEDYPKQGDPKWVTGAEIAKALGVNPSTVRRVAAQRGWYANAKLVVTPQGGGRVWLYRVTDAAAWWQERHAAKLANA